MTDSALAMDLTYVEKRYGKRVHALKGVSLKVARGEVFGLLGPNGAGKSTLVKILMTVVTPTRAEGTVLGRPVATKEALQRVGYLPENHRFPKYLTGRQTLDFFAALSGAPRSWRKRRIPELLEIVGMTEWADQKVSRYSKGMLQRVGIAQALSADPELVVLDEPTDGVDPMGRRDIRDVLVRLRDEGKTVFINSHLLSELEMICDRVAIMVAGQVARQGTLADLAVSRRSYEVEVEAEPQAIETALSAGGAVAAAPSPASAPAPVGGPPPLPGQVPARPWSLPSGLQFDVRGRLLRIQATQAAEVQPLLDLLRGGGVVLKRIQPVQPTLEDLFMEAVAETAGGDKPGARFA
jgi:ABC-2 type transport system ATP-binding protein